MKSIRRFLWLFACWMTAATAIHAQGGFYLKDGDRVVFYGDSITDQRLYTTFVETYAVTRYPRLKATFVHSGWGGDRVTGGGGGSVDVRLQRDVIAHRPTVVTVMLGMNDGSVRPFDDKIFETFATGYRHLLQMLKSHLPGLRLTLIQPSPYDDVTRPPAFEKGYNAVLVRYGEFVKKLAVEEAVQVADLNGPVVDALVKALQSDAALAPRIIPDRVHPGPAGHLLMAAALLKAWNAPALVTSVEVDAATRSVVSAVNTELTQLKWGSHLEWFQLDQALPLPLDMNNPIIALAVRSSDVLDSLNKQMLIVKGLSSPRYRLRIDGEEVGIFTSSQLEAGVNLGALSTPMQKQATAVHGLTLRHNDIHFARWRHVQVALEKDASVVKKEAINALDSLELHLVEEQRAAAQPKSRHYQLVPD